MAEYTGELIDHCEADRRGKAYDRDSNTYLFDLNDEWVIDAKQRGNKMRFANHRCTLYYCLHSAYLAQLHVLLGLPWIMANDTFPNHTDVANIAVDSLRSL